MHSFKKMRTAFGSLGELPDVDDVVVRFNFYASVVDSFQKMWVASRSFGQLPKAVKSER